MTADFGSRSDLVTVFDPKQDPQVAGVQAGQITRRHDPSIGETSSLRNSCDACAQAKLKCKKEKPTCSRCAKRGIPCQYLYSKRAGRKPSKPNNNTGGEQHETSQVSQNNTPLHADASYDYFGTGLQQFASATGGTTPSVLSDLNLSELLDFSTVPGLELGKADLSSELDGSWATNPGSSSSSGSSLEDPGGDIPMGDFSMDDDFFAGNSLPDPYNLSTIFSGSGNRDLHDAMSPEANCPCLQRALQDMQRVSGLTSSVGGVWSGTTVDGRAMLRTSLDVVKENKDILRGILHTLACPGPHNGHLLALLTFVLSSVVNLYAIITSSRPPPASGQQPPVPNMDRSSSVSSLASLGDYNADQEDPVHAAAYIVFGELQQLRKSCEQLAHRLKDHAILQEGSAASQFGGKIQPSLSANICHTLETDLNRLFKELALAVVQKLT